MTSWDIFHADRLELVRDLDDEAVRRGLADGSLTEDDLARPSGSGAPWTRLGDLPDLLAPPAEAETKPAAPAPEPRRPAVPETIADLSTMNAESPPDTLFRDFFADDSVAGFDLGLGPDSLAGRSAAGAEHAIPDLVPSWPAESEPAHEPAEIEAEIEEEIEEEAGSRPGLQGDKAGAEIEAATPVAALPPALVPRDEPDLAGAVLDTAHEEDEEDEEHASLASGGAAEMEDLDLTAMADIAMQMIMFLLVAATVVYFKTLEIPNPSPEEGNGAVAQSMLTPEELSETYILVEIDPQGRIQIDGVPVEPAALVQQLRSAREETLRTQMLLLADFQTPHANTVSALDAAAEIGLAISLARPPAP